MRIRLFASLAVVAVLASAASVHAKSPVQVTPDDSAIIVNKTVGTGSNAEQWVLSLSLNDETLSGNVFEVSGAAPTFFFCDVDSPDGFSEPQDLADQTLTFTCSIAAGCSALPCDPDTEWHPLGGDPPTLPGTFFLP
jgi:hypothetical protein